jgi:hypothetical protein
MGNFVYSTCTTVSQLQTQDKIIVRKTLSISIKILGKAGLLFHGAAVVSSRGAGCPAAQTHP